MISFYDTGNFMIYKLSFFGLGALAQIVFIFEAGFKYLIPPNPVNIT